MSALDELARDRVLGDLARDSGTVLHAVRADYIEERARLLALFPDAPDECAAEAMQHVTAKFREFAAHRRRIANGGRL